VTFLDFVAPLVCLQGQTDSICFDFSNPFDILPHALLFHKLSSYGLSSGYLNWFLSYLTNRQSGVRFSVILFIVLSGIPQVSLLGPLLFKIFINDLCDVINHSNYLRFADDLKVYRALNSRSDRLLLQSDIDCVHAWCLANFIKPNFSKIKAIGRIKFADTAYQAASLRCIVFNKCL
jgi:hypothetical protein